MIHTGAISIFIIVTSMIIGLASVVVTQTNTAVTGQIQKESKMSSRANGTFEVKLSPQTPSEHAGAAAISRMTIDKQFQGDLEGTSKGEMLAVTTGVEGSAGYVAIEKVTAKLKGRSGTFALQHGGIMTRGAPQLSVVVVPDSGTGELVGLTGKMMITIAEGKHSYEFDYTVPEKP